MTQQLNEIRQLLQQKIFGHTSIKNFNICSQAIFNRLNKCHTAAIGVHHLKCNKASCDNQLYQYHPSFIGTVTTGIALIAGDLPAGRQVKKRTMAAG